MKRMVGVSVSIWLVAFVVWSSSWVNSLSALSLTAPEGESLGNALLKSVVVLVTWFGAVMVAPVLTLTACAWSALNQEAFINDAVRPTGHRGIQTIERTGSNTTASASTKNDAAT